MGDGPRTAVLVHGLLSDHGAWCRVAPAMVARGYHVVMPELRGHGLSPPGEYLPDAWADDLVETLPTDVELAVGHSLGGMSLSLAVERLRPKLAAYVDPAWKMTAAQHKRYRPEFHEQLNWDASRLRAAHPRWSDEDIAARVASMSRFDPRCIDGLLPGGGHDRMPRSCSVPSLVMLADPSDLVPPEDAAVLKNAGFDVRYVAASGHSIFRDDLSGFLAALDDWLAA
ncbi:MAG TPA: alpha/beta hydrolase [Candidatus Dormibacteraeota bacterium]|nr:alpha/beta hydrolase [Candidatus Dormibacteraeota bacterium]